MADLSAYPELFFLLNKDRAQTRTFLRQGGRELNPFLGEYPSAGIVNRAVGAAALAPILADVLVHNRQMPPWMAQLLKDSMIYTERLATNRNEETARNPRLEGHLPIGLAYSGTADWDRDIARWLERVLGRN